MALYSGYIIGWSLLHPKKIPPRDPPLPFRKKLAESTKLIPCLLLILGVFFSLVLGFATATECAAWGVAARCCSPGGAARSTARLSLKA